MPGFVVPWSLVPPPPVPPSLAYRVPQTPSLLLVWMWQVHPSPCWAQPRGGCSQTLKMWQQEGKHLGGAEACPDPCLSVRQPLTLPGRMCPVLPLKAHCHGVCRTVAQLLGGGSDLAERREVQSRQRAVEHIPHRFQQPEAGKHLVKEVRERLLQGERQGLGAGGHIAP